ncbi:MAG: phytanoyl-CoA dioxygenase family protein [Bryobacteraceae bacterium]
MISSDEAQLNQWKQRYDRDGFLEIRGLLDAAELAALEAELDRYFREIAPGLPAGDIVWEKEPMPDGSRRVRNLWRMEQYSPFFASLAQNPRLLALAGKLVNGDPVSMGVELFAKPARVGSAVPHHQDNAYFNLTPPDSFTCWIALDASTPENGCVHYTPGSHRWQPLPHKASGVQGNSMMADHVPADLVEIPGPLSPGDAMLHHCLTVHRSEPNRSERPRRGLLIVFKGAHCQRDPEGWAKYSEVRSAVA